MRTEPQSSLADRPEFAVHHPDDETLTVADALTRLHRDDHQRIAALVEWLAEELARKNSAIYEALHHLRRRSDPSHRWPGEVEDARKALRDA